MKTRTIKIGNVLIGGGRDIAVQSMLCARCDDVVGNVEQAVRLENAGCDIIRVSVPTQEALKLIPAIKSAVSMPLVADIHFDYRLAIESVKAGADKIRINPGNIGSSDRLKAVVECCAERDVPIRVGVNSGSLEAEMLEKYGSPTAEAMAESAIRNVKLIEDFGYHNIAVSIKSSDISTMVNANRRFAEKMDYPLHIGVTEAGTLKSGIVKSAIGIGALLIDGIGDTLRVSLTDDPVEEVKAAHSILKAVGKKSGVTVISCPTCGRTQINIPEIASEIEERTKDIKANLKVAVMGCIVNGPGEASEADIGIAGGKDCAMLFKKGVQIRKLTGNIVEQLMEEINSMLSQEQ